MSRATKALLVSMLCFGCREAPPQPHVCRDVIARAPTWAMSTIECGQDQTPEFHEQYVWCRCMDAGVRRP